MPEEEYAFDEPTPADTVYTTADGTFIHRIGYPLLKLEVVQNVNSSPTGRGLNL